MTDSFESRLTERLLSIDIFEKGTVDDAFVGHPFYFDYSAVKVLVNDKWKARVGGIPAGCFLLCSYTGSADELVLVRVLGPSALPTDSDVIASMVDFYKEGVPRDETKQRDPKADPSKLDTYTRYEFNFSGLSCRVLGTFHRDGGGRTVFGADIDNFYAPHNYSVYKPKGKVLEAIVNYRQESGLRAGGGVQRIGEVRYAASHRHEDALEAPVYVSPTDYLGKRTALFGMTRTGKSNTVKKIIQATCDLAASDAKLEGEPVGPIGQIIFDVNGEYANKNLQDEGTAIFDLYRDDTIRYSTLKKEGFKELKVNFYTELSLGFEMIKSDPEIASDQSRFAANFRNVDLTEPRDMGERKRWQRRVAAYHCVLNAAKFRPPDKLTLEIPANQQVREAVRVKYRADRNGVMRLNVDQASAWFGALWEVYGQDPTGCFAEHKEGHDGREWAEDDLKALLTMLTLRRNSGGTTADCSGFRIIEHISSKHTSTLQDSFKKDILEQLRQGKIVIVDLSLGDDVEKRFFSEQVCQHIFHDALRRFTAMEANNYIQFYFEEAHNLFPRKEDKDLSHIYNRLAKEGAKLNLGLLYATQEVSSLSANVLKNTQNWFVSHLNNQDELREIAKYYDFEDFTDGLRRITRKGFVRMKTYSNPFIVPVQVDKFSAS